MRIEPDAPPEGALEDVTYLSRSGNRIHVLALLATKPCTSRDLRDAIDASRSTIRRILAELVERGWVERTSNGAFVATVTGEHVVTAFTPLLESMRSIRELGEALSWLPADELTIGLHHFSDATVRRADPNSPVAEASYLHEQLREATTYANLTSIGPPLSMMETTRDGVASGRLTATTVLTGDLVAYLQTRPEQLPLWSSYVTSGGRAYCYEGEIPCTLHVVDETVLVGTTRTGQPCEFIETDDETVLSWARSVIESHQEEAVRLGPDAFAEESPVACGKR